MIRIVNFRTHMILLIAVLSVLSFLPVPAAADDSRERPHWSVELKGGAFYPDIPDWKTHYGSDRTWQIAGALAYKPFRMLDIGIEGGMMKDRGQGLGAITGDVTGAMVTHELYPLNLFALVRGVFSEEQWIVPYAGGGYTRMFYRQTIEGQDSVKGAVNGYHGRAGLQILLDNADARAANNLYQDFGIIHTYLFFEAQIIKADAETLSGSTVNLGGTSYLSGLLFEF